jgi:acyl-[acyl carrier protein]--UDP-N-acetylglucosamine O-acyltransferase
MIHPTSIVSLRAKIGYNVSVGPFSIVHDNVEVGDSSVIGSHCELGYSGQSNKQEKLIIGAESTIRSHSVIYSGSRFGERLVTGHRVTVRAGVNAGVNLQIGTLNDIQGICRFGDYVRLHSNVHIGQGSVIEDFV